MATVTSSIPAAMDAFVDGLKERQAIIDAGVQVSSGYLAGDVAAKESIALLDWGPANQSWGMLGNRRRDEEYSLNGWIWVVKTGKGEDVIRAARTRAFELLAEIEDFLRDDPTIGGTTKVSELTGYPGDQGIHSDGGRWVQIEFEVSCKKDLRSS